MPRQRQTAVAAPLSRSTGKKKRKKKALKVDAQFIADTKALVEEALNTQQRALGPPLDAESDADDMGESNAETSDALQKESLDSWYWKPDSSFRSQIGAVLPSKQGRRAHSSPGSVHKNVSLSDLEQQAMVRSTVPAFYRQRIDRQPMPRRMDGTLKPLGYDVRKDVSPADPVASYQALAKFPKRHSERFIQEFTSGLSQPEVATMLSSEMIQRQQQALETEMMGDVLSVESSLALIDNTRHSKGSNTSSTLAKRQGSDAPSNNGPPSQVVLERHARNKLWRNRMVSHLAQPMSAAIFTSNQAPTGLPGAGLAFDPSVTSNSYEAFAYSQLAHDAATVIQRCFQRRRRKRRRAATKLQACGRGLVARTEFRRRRANVLRALSIIHRIARGKLGRLAATRRRQLLRGRNAVKIQSAFRYHREKLLLYRHRMDIARRAARRLQARYRGARLRRVVRQQQQQAAAIALQRRFRGHAVRNARFKKESKLGRSADHLLKVFRGKVAIAHVRARRFAMRCRKAIQIQCLFRCYAAKHQQERRLWAVCVIQKYAWGHVGRLRFEKHRQRLENEALSSKISTALIEAREYISTKEGKELVKKHRAVIKDRRKAEKVILKSIPDKEARKRMERSINEREAFEMFDQDGSGLIDTEEFKRVVQELGVALSPEDRELAFRTLDKDNSGTVDFVEFAAWYAHVTENDSGKVLSPELGLLKLALGATRALKRLLGIDLLLLSKRAAVMERASEQVAALRKAWRDWPPHTLANKPRFNKYHPPYCCDVSLEGFVSQWLLEKHNARQPPAVPSDVMTLGQVGRRRGGALKGQAQSVSKKDSGKGGGTKNKKKK